MDTFYGEEPSPSMGQRWDTLYGASPGVTLYRSHDGAREIVVVHGDSVEGCGSEGQQLTSLFALDKAGKRERLVELMSLAWTLPPEGLVDLDADGVLEMFTNKSVSGSLTLERWHGDRAAPSEDNDYQDERREQVDSLTIPDLTAYGCPC
jgi:hypothetical protein